MSTDRRGLVHGRGASGASAHHETGWASVTAAGEIAPKCPRCGAGNMRAREACPACGAGMVVGAPGYGVAGMVPPARESPAHHLLNGAVQLWTLLLVAVIVVPILVSNGQGGIGAAVGFSAAAILFVPWAIGLVILLVLRSTTRAR